MVLTYNTHIIEVYSEAVIKETKVESSYPKGGFWLIDAFFDFLIKRTNKKITSKLNQLENAVNSFLPHIDNMTLEQAEIALKDAKELNKKMITSKEDLKNAHFPVDPLLDDVFKNTLRVLFKYENTLHKKVYRDKPIIKTPDNLREGVMKMNNNNIERLLK